MFCIHEPFRAPVKSLFWLALGLARGPPLHRVTLQTQSLLQILTIKCSNKYTADLYEINGTFQKIPEYTHTRMYSKLLRSRIRPLRGRYGIMTPFTGLATK